MKASGGGMRTPGYSAVWSIDGKNHLGKHRGLGDARSPGTSGDEGRLIHVGCTVISLAPHAGGEDPGFEPSECNSSSY